MSESRTGAKVERLPLARYTTLGVGGESEVWFVSTHEQLAEAMEQPYRILGGGSNLVVSDAGVAVLSAYAGLRSAALNVYVNAKGLDDRAFAEERLKTLEGLLGEAGALNEKVYGIVKGKVS